MRTCSGNSRSAHSQVPNVLRLESSLFHLVGQQLAAMKHSVRPLNGEDVGGVHWMMFTTDPLNGLLSGGIRPSQGGPGRVLVSAAHGGRLSEPNNGSRVP
jgi:gamma-glutamyltranspeptidase / glutathione hydrolase